MTLAPIIGSIIGHLVFNTGLPGFWTWIGGPILIVGIILVVVSSSEADTNNETMEVAVDV